MHVLALCGSLRQQSRSMALLQAAQLLAQEPMKFTIFQGMSEISLFNPDLEPNPPQAIQSLWRAVEQADVIVIASPEYAHGITGVMKNTLDWLVGFIPFAEKPVVILNPSHRAIHADTALHEVLRTMSATLIEAACLRIPVTANSLDAQALTFEPSISTLIKTMLTAIEHYFATLQQKG